MCYFFQLVDTFFISYIILAADSGYQITFNAEDFMVFIIVCHAANVYMYFCHVFCKKTHCELLTTRLSQDALH